MVDVVPANDKLRAARVRRVVGEVATGASPEAVDEALAAADGEPKAAIITLVAGVDAQTARERLAAADGQPPTGVGAMRLEVEAALVAGQLCRSWRSSTAGSRGGPAGTNGRGIAAPGFIDLQVNGVRAASTSSTRTPTATGGRARRCSRPESTSFLPTLITAPANELVDVLAGRARATTTSHGIVGVHLEGPFLAEEKLGTYPRLGRRDPDLALLAQLLDAGPIRMMTLAPELPGALEPIDALRARDRRVLWAQRRRPPTRPTLRSIEAPPA